MRRGRHQSSVEARRAVYGLAALLLALFGVACSNERQGVDAAAARAAAPTSVSVVVPPPETATLQPANELIPECRTRTSTPAQTEGPYYKAGSPGRTTLWEPGMGGTRLLITGSVVDTDCRPIAGAWLDFWQADDAGRYDNDGYTLRGHQYTDEHGRFTLETTGRRRPACRAS
ncbi:MAG: hypothetical protein C4290_07295 [Chloroflexota bacterium]